MHVILNQMPNLLAESQTKSVALITSPLTIVVQTVRLVVNLLWGMIMFVAKCFTSCSDEEYTFGKRSWAAFESAGYSGVQILYAIGNLATLGLLSLVYEPIDESSADQRGLFLEL